MQINTTRNTTTHSPEQLKFKRLIILSVGKDGANETLTLLGQGKFVPHFTKILAITMRTEHMLSL